MIKDFDFIIPQNCQFGMGALKKLPDFLKAAGSDNVMLISDRGLEAIGVVDKVREIIKGCQPEVQRVPGCSAQPHHHHRG